MIEIRYAEKKDKPFWFSLDRHLDEKEFDYKIDRKMAYVILLDGVPAGLMRYNLFWDSIPFCTMLYIAGDCQRKGLGRQLLEHWEAEMRAMGYGMALTSTQTDEQAQHFYRKLGYRDCGGITFDIPGYEQPMELVLCKAL